VEWFQKISSAPFFCSRVAFQSLPLVRHKQFVPSDVREVFHQGSVFWQTAEIPERLWAVFGQAGRNARRIGSHVFLKGQEAGRRENSPQTG
jgi:hypothetical protein